jgi:hypothetical protein
VKRALVAIALAACGGGGGDDGDGDSGVVTAEVDWDGEPFTLEAACEISDSGDLRVIDGVDPDRMFGVEIVWNRATARTGVAYDTDVLGVLSLHVVRPHDDGLRVSSAGEGTAEFTELGDAAGDTISGSFDDLVMMRDEPDDMITVTMTGGSFDCVVPAVE